MEDIMAWQSILEKHPEHTRLIGMIAIETGNLELALANLFARMLLVPLRIGRAVYLTPQSSQARLHILKNAARAEFDRPMRSKVLTDRCASALKRVIEVHDRANKSILRRHRVVHDSWGFNDDDGQVSRLMIDGNPDRESASAPINELRDQLRSLRKLIDDAGVLAREFHNNPPMMIDLRLSGTPKQTRDRQTRWPRSPSSPETARRRRSLPP
jgi:hypothetical protein